MQKDFSLTYVSWNWRGRLFLYVPLLRSIHWLPEKFRDDFKIWPRKLLVKNNLFFYTPCLLLHFHHVHWDQIKESLDLYLESRLMLGKGHLSLIFDKNFNFSSHISAICSSCIYHFRDIRRIRRHLDLDSANLLANALVSSRFDYYNSLLSAIAETDLTKLQRVLNRLTHVVTKSPPLTRSVSTAALPSLATSTI